MIYFLEDDDSIRKLVIYGLESQGFEAEGFSLPYVRRLLESVVPQPYSD